MAETRLAREIDLSASVSLAEAASMVEHVGEKVSFIFKGEMGIGKSAILNTLASKFRDAYRYVYAETQTFDTGDVSGCPFVELINGVKVTRFAPNILTGVHSDKPICFMADEVGKALRPVQNAMLRLFQSQKIGEYSLPMGSRVFGTTNLAAEGLGDHIQSHAQNRVSYVRVRKPTAEQWILWAMGNGIHPVLIAWVKRFPLCLDSYIDSAAGNPYIYYPSKTTDAFVTPRSLENASHILWAREHLGDNATTAALLGCVGSAAARDLMNFAQTNDRLPSWDAIVNTPDTAPVPTQQDFAANFITVFSAITLVERKTLTAWMTYCKRLPKEYQGVFALNIKSSPKRDMALSNRGFVVWATENHWML